MLGLTQRLHSVEVERRSLIGKVNHWQKEAKEFKGAVEQTAILGRKVQELESMVRGILCNAPSTNRIFAGNGLT